MAQVSRSTEDTLARAERIYEQVQGVTAELGALVNLLRAKTQAETEDDTDV